LTKKDIEQKLLDAEELRKAFEAAKLAKANQTTVKILKGKVRKAQEPRD